MNRPPADASPLLLDLGAALDLCRSLGDTRGSVEEALTHLRFVFCAKISPRPSLQARAREALRLRLRARAVRPA